jgi:protein-S-isoprenylcysteine O-methyltransferase Ste14
METMQDRLLDQARHAYSPRQRAIALTVLAPIFLAVLPLILISLGSLLNRWLHWPLLWYAPVNLVLALLLILAGWLFALWSIYAQFTLGRGTPVPLMATQKLVVQPPYTWCRNPMALGAILMYAGVAVLFGSIGAFILVLLGSACLLVYIKLLEEKEMLLRFGQEYLDYKRRTPFLIPRFGR